MLHFFALILACILTGCTQKSSYKPSPFTDCVTINDFSRLNQTIVRDIHEPSTLKELADLVTDAARQNIKVAVAGSLHSQGGHAFYPSARIIRLKKFNHVIDFDAEQKTITVQAGITWQDMALLHESIR
jgi:decaprenylphospho-beta-D-ribofuranose 2-oxidase